jgi:tRNA G18 (ribose-2'-O)-methylase SpoU
MILFKKIKILSETKSLRLKSILKIKVYIASLRWKILILPKNTKMQPTKKLKLEELGRIDVETFKKTEKIPLVVILDNVRSMHNVGAAFRTADAFLVEKIILCGITPKPPHREIHKAALGATESVDWQFYESVKEAVIDLKTLGFEIVGIEQTTNSVMITDFEIDKTKKYALVLGNEVEGISDEILTDLDVCLEIPQLGTKHSLNVSVCGGIVMWEFFKNLK